MHWKEVCETVPIKIPKAILFDLDGVVIDSLDVMKKAFCMSYRRLMPASHEIPLREYLQYNGEAFGTIMRKMGLPEAMEAAFRAESLRLAENIPLHDGIVEILQYLSRNEIKIALVTGKDKLRTLDLLDRLKIDRYFGAIVTACDVRNCKPDPEPVLSALDSLGVDAHDSAMLGDSKNDIISANRAGASAWGVSWGVGTKQELYEAGAEVVFDRAEQVLNVLSIA